MSSSLCVSDFPQEVRWDLRMFWVPVALTPLFLVPLLIFQDLPFSSQPGRRSHLFHWHHSSTLELARRAGVACVCGQANLEFGCLAYISPTLN